MFSLLDYAGFISAKKQKRRLSLDAKMNTNKLSDGRKYPLGGSKNNAEVTRVDTQLLKDFLS